MLQEIRFWTESRREVEIVQVGDLAPRAHAENSTLAHRSTLVGVSVEQAVRRLNQAGVGHSGSGPGAKVGQHCELAGRGHLERDAYVRAAPANCGSVKVAVTSLD